MYCDDKDSQKRKNSINTLKYSLYFLLKWLHPILVFTTEEVFQILKSNSKNSEKFEESIFLVDFKKIKIKIMLISMYQLGKYYKRLKLRLTKFLKT